MSRHVELERILQVWFDFESASAAHKGERRVAFHRLLDEARAGSNVSRQDLVVSLASRYHDFRAAKEKELRSKLSRLH